jgi:hypothetical protein
MDKQRAEASVAARFAHKTRCDIGRELRPDRAARDDRWRPHPTRLVHVSRFGGLSMTPASMLVDFRIWLPEGCLPIPRLPVHRQAFIVSVAAFSPFTLCSCLRT